MMRTANISVVKIRLGIVKRKDNNNNLFDPMKQQISQSDENIFNNI